MPEDAAFTREVLRLHARYVAEIVETFDICPFARRARQHHRVRHLILLDPEPSVEGTIETIEGLTRELEDIDVAQLIYPRVTLTPRQFDVFHGAVRERDGRRRMGEPPFVSASFHPDYPLDLRSPEQLVPYLRRTPDPTLQLLRYANLKEVRDDTARGTSFIEVAHMKLDMLTAEESVSLPQRIARNNHDAVQRVGVDRLAAIYEDIRADRLRTYARFDLS